MQATVTRCPVATSPVARAATCRPVPAALRASQTRRMRRGCASESVVNVTVAVSRIVTPGSKPEIAVETLREAQRVEVLQQGYRHPPGGAECLPGGGQGKGLGYPREDDGGTVGCIRPSATSSACSGAANGRFPAGTSEPAAPPQGRGEARSGCGPPDPALFLDQAGVDRTSTLSRCMWAAQAASRAPPPHGPLTAPRRATSSAASGIRAGRTSVSDSTGAAHAARPRRRMRLQDPSR